MDEFIRLLNFQVVILIEKMTKNDTNCLPQTLSIIQLFSTEGFKPHFKQNDGQQLNFAETDLKLNTNWQVLDWSVFLCLIG